jgi:hypothetical protein
MAALRASCDAVNFTQEQLDEFAAEWNRLMTPEAVAAHWDREWRRIHRELPRRVRFRLWWRHRIDSAGIWLARHEHPGCAVALWRMFGMWR